MAFEAADFPIMWKGKGLDEVGYSPKLGEIVVRINPEYYRPAEVDTLLGDSSAAQIELNWKPRTTLNQLVEEMVEHDLRQEWDTSTY
jgi:GDPmannose 4,6-dehydratase